MIARNVSPASGADEPSKAPRPLRILVADDDRDSVLTLMMVLRHGGHEARGVYKGADVVKAIEDFQPDAAFIDISMPDLSGYEVARRIREQRGGDKILLIAISGIYRKHLDVLLGTIAGFDHYLTKPYQPSDLLRLIAPLRLPAPDG